jgi:UDP:flavonoid glycosyltransferase YjiC (YdhE family)
LDRTFARPLHLTDTRAEAADAAQRVCSSGLLAFRSAAAAPILNVSAASFVGLPIGWGMTRVLFSSTWGYGHLFPLLPLARAFLGAGHEVVVATSADSCRHVVAAGLPAAPAGLSGTQLRESVRDQVSASESLAPEERAGFLFPRMFGDAFAPPMVADLLPFARQWRPDLIIHEQGELAAPLVAAALGVPSMTHAFGGAVPASFVAEASSRLSSLWARHGQALLPYAGCYTSPYLDICPPAVQSVPLSHIGAIQALRPIPDTGQGPDGSPDYLRTDGSPLIYLTFGTVHQPRILQAAVAALAALPIRLLVALGPNGNPSDLGDQPENVRIERWVHQPSVLERSAVVVSHAGSGTFLGALSHGVPQLCLPQGADQFRNADGGSRAGAVLALTPSKTTPEAITTAVARLLAEEHFRVNAQKVASDIQAMPSPASVVEELTQEL